MSLFLKENPLHLMVFQHTKMIILISIVVLFVLLYLLFKPKFDIIEIYGEPYRIMWYYTALFSYIKARSYVILWKL